LDGKRLIGEERASSFSYGSLQELALDCAHFYKRHMQKNVDSSFVANRKQLAEYIRKFHSDCGTLTEHVKKAVERLKDNTCLLLMTAHQPNLFAYSGVLRKATLNYVLEKQMSDVMNVSVVNFFGVADHDFTDDRWVKSALLPDVERRGGTLELRVDLPPKKVLSRTSRLPRSTLERLRGEIADWLERKSRSVDRSFKSLGFGLNLNSTGLLKNFEGFWELVEAAYARAETYSDFNAFVTSKIINEAWGYDTVFCRFSECQRIFRREFAFLVSRFDDYSRYVKDATVSVSGSGRGVFSDEYLTMPFWYHCDCGSKARLMAESKNDSLLGRGACVSCGREYEVDFKSKKKPAVAGLLSRVSTRSLSMPLVFFKGLGVSCYVGGVGGQEYLREAEYVAEGLGICFPPIVVWRPSDVYTGIGQLDAVMKFKELSGTFDLSRYSATRARMKKKIEIAEQKIKQLASDQFDVIDDSVLRKEEKIERTKMISIKQTRMRKKTGFALLVSRLKMLENVEAVMHLYPCIVDYAVNVGLSATSEQWVEFLDKVGNLSENIQLHTGFDYLARLVQPSGASSERS
jgi:hypothetical protein